MPPGTSLPDVPTAKSWFKSIGDRMVNLNAVSGSDNWRVIAQQFKATVPNFSTGQFQTVNATLIVGVNLGDINGAVSQLAGIDLIVSLIIIVGLAIVGVAIVRASLRPLVDIERTAQAIAAGDLSRRVPDQDPITEVGRLGRSLNTMLAQIESSFHAQARSEAAARRSEERMRQFVADASHELRTPLTAMRGYAEYYRQRGGMHDTPADPGRPGGGQRRRPRAAGTGNAGPTDPGRHGPDHAAGRAGVGPDGRAGRGHAAAGPAGSAAADRAPAGGPAHAGRGRGAGRADHRPGPGHQPRRRVRRRLPDPGRRGAAAPGHRQPDEQRADPHPGGHPGRRPGAARAAPAGAQRRPGGRRPGPRLAPGPGGARVRAVLPGRPGADQERRRHRPGPGHRGRARGGARRHRRAEDRAGAGRHVPDHPAARPGSPRRPARRGRPGQPGQPGRGRGHPGRLAGAGRLVGVRCGESREARRRASGLLSQPAARAARAAASTDSR